MASHVWVSILRLPRNRDGCEWRLAFGSKSHTEAYRHFLSFTEYDSHSDFAMIGFSETGCWQVLMYHGGMHEGDTLLPYSGMLRFGLFDGEHESLVQECNRLARKHTVTVAGSM